MDPISFVATLAIEAAVNFGISYLFPSEGPRIKDLTVSSSTYGAAIPNIFGTARAAGCLIWADRVIEHKQEKSAGKGGSYNSYTYTCTFSMAFARGPIADITRIWADGKLIYDTTGLSPTTVNNSKYHFTIYKGSEDQLQDPYIVAVKGIANTPAYRGLAHVVFQNFAMSDFGNRIPQFAAQVVNTANPTVPFLDLVYENPVGINVGALDGMAGSQFIQADYSRGYGYVVGFPTAGGANGFRRFRLSDGVEDRDITSAEMGVPLPGPISSDTYYNNGSITTFCGVGKDGSLYVNAGGFNGQPLYRIDPVTYTIAAKWPQDSSGFNGFPNTYPEGASQAARESVFSNDGNSMVHFDLFGVNSIHDTKTLLPQGLIAHQDGLTDKRIYGACAFLSDTFCFLVWPTSNVIELQDTTVVMYSETISNLAHPNWCVYDSGVPGVIYAYTTTDDGVWLAKFSADTGAIAWRTKLPSGVGTLSGNSLILNNELAFCGAPAGPDTYTQGFIINTTDGTFVDRDADPYAAKTTKDISQTAYLPNNDGGHGWPTQQGVPEQQTYNSLNNDIMAMGSLSPNQFVYVGMDSGATTTLEAIVEQLLREGGLTTGDFDLSALGETIVRGYGFANNSDVKAILAELRQIYLFDLFESDFILKARMRGGAEADETINGLVLGSSSKDVRDEWKQTRIQEADLPAKITMAYMDVNNDFQVSTANYKRPSKPIPTMFSEQQAAVQANIVLDGTQAKNLVRKMLFTQWLERTKHDTRLPWAYSYLDPSDLITVNMPDGRTYFERIDQMEIGADLTIVTETFSQDSSAYIGNPATVGDGGSGAPQTIKTASPARIFVLNTPLLRDSDDGGGSASRYYTAVGNDGTMTATFNGALIERSINGSDYDVLNAMPVDIEWGVTSAALPPASHGTGSLDWETQLIIVPANNEFSLTSITYDQLWAGGNPLIVGQEVIQFKDAVHNSDGTWTVTNLLRGRRGTEWAHNTHTSHEVVIAPNGTNMLINNETLDATGQFRFFKAVGTGTSENTAPVEKIDYYPRDLMPYAVGDIRRDLDTDITITWKRRTRFGGNLMDSTGDVPLNETSEAYEIYFLTAAFDGDKSTNEAPRPALLKRLAATTTGTFVYTAAMQSADGFVQNLDTLHIVIYQLSGAVGRGFPSTRDIEPWRDF